MRSAICRSGCNRSYCECWKADAYVVSAGTEEIEVDVRLVAATNRDLRKRVQEGTFREDLFFRLSVLEIHLPPLRERKEDLPELCDAILRDLNTAYGTSTVHIHADVMGIFQRHNWPGNIRELRNVLERALVIAGGAEILPAHLPQSIQNVAPEPPRRSYGATPTVTLTAGTTLRGRGTRDDPHDAGVHK